MAAFPLPARSPMPSPRWGSFPWPTAAAVVLVLAVWQVVGEAELIGNGALPSPVAIGDAWWTMRGDLPPHVQATLRVALTGFLIGNTAAILLAVAGYLVPAVERLTRLTTLVVYCVPPVVIIPILGIAMDGDWPKISVATMLVFFPTLVATRLGLQNSPGDAAAVVRSSGGSVLRQLWLVRFRGALPDILAGLQIAAPAAVLGTMLGEFTGGRHGLGLYLAGSMTRGESAVIWAIGLTATALSIALYAVLGTVRALLGVERTRPAIDLSGTRAVRRRRSVASVLRSLAWGIGGLGVLLAVWWGFIAWTGLPTVLMNSPVEVVENLVTGENAGRNWDRITPALRSSLGVAVLGCAMGIGCAFVLGIVLGTFASAAKAVMPFAFVSQTIPIVALAPLLAVVFGRGTETTLAVTVSATFFPSLMIIMQGIAASPEGPRHVLRSVDASAWVVLTRLTVPNAVPHLLAAVRLAVPLALTGVLLAEQFITGTGLGGLLSTARGTLNYQMMWSVAVVVTILSTLMYLVVQLVEAVVLRRRS